MKYIEIDVRMHSIVHGYDEKKMKSQNIEMKLSLLKSWWPLSEFNQ